MTTQLEPASPVRMALTHDGDFCFQIEVGRSAYSITAWSPVPDPIGGFVRTALVIATNGWRAAWSFEDEPVEWRVVADRHWIPGTSNLLRLRILWFDDYYAHLPDEEGVTQFEAICLPDEFAREALRVAQAMWDGLGPEHRWTVGLYPFPFRAVEALKSALQVEDPPLHIEEIQGGGGWTIFEAPKTDAR